MFGYLFSVVAGAFGGYLLHAVSMKVNFKILQIIITIL